MTLRQDKPEPEVVAVDRRVVAVAIRRTAAPRTVAPAAAANHGAGAYYWPLYTALEL